MASGTSAFTQWSLDGGVAVVEVLAYELNQPKFAEALGVELHALLDARPSDRVLIDFHNTKYMSSTAFGALVRFVKDATVAGVRVAVCGMEPAVRMGADIISLDRFIPVVDDRTAGLAALGAGGAA